MRVLDAGDEGAIVTELIDASGLETNDALYVIRAMIEDGTLMRLKSGRLANGLPLKRKDPE